MKLRAPAYPLITVDPYFSVWAMTDRLTDDDTKHWTGKPNTIRAYVTIDGEKYSFMGKTGYDPLLQVACDIEAMTTRYVFESPKIRLFATFFSPRILDDVEILSRPVSYLFLQYESIDGEEHDVQAYVAISEELCLNEKGQSAVSATTFELENGIVCAKMGNTVQNVLNRSGDDLRIDWGYVYLATDCENASSDVNTDEDGMTFIEVSGDVCDCCGAMFVFAYDDIYSIEYFGKKLKSVWNKDGKTIEQLLPEAFSDYTGLFADAKIISDELFSDAVMAGGEKYAELLLLAYRQSISAHKLAVDENGELLFISKECFSNGCAATVDVSYPSIPLFLLYNPELVKGMMRPIIRFAQSDKWIFDFAPHDCGQYPLVNGQVYGGIDSEKNQMPVEECGNMLIMLANICIAEKDPSFAKDNLDLYRKWAKYLLDFGRDPQNQLCTDDFAGHLAHNCNLSLKAIMGLTGLSAVLDMLGEEEESDYYYEQAIEMALEWCETAADENGGFRLAFDQQGSFSMKYNMIWDKLWGTNLFPRQVIDAELLSNESHLRPYGLPLDSRKDYTKSDWLVWTAALANNRTVFERFTDPLWNAYNFSKSRVPLTDWYDTVTASQVGFQNRTVIGGLYIRLLDFKGTVDIHK